MSKSTKRRDHAKWRAQVHAANRARARAQAILVSRYPAEFDELHAMTAALEDPPVKPKPFVTEDEQQLRATIRELQQKLRELGR